LASQTVQAERFAKQYKQDAFHRSLSSSYETSSTAGAFFIVDSKYPRAAI
jgi:hypothetical protein